MRTDSPPTLIDGIAGLKHGGTYRGLSFLLKNKLIGHVGTPYDGYHLNYSGYDYLALKAFSARGTVVGVAQQIGVGKESDVYRVVGEGEVERVAKFQRLGRTSFRSIKLNRDYHGKRKSASWLYLSRLAAMKEFAYMKVLWDHGFPVPEPVDVNRHAVIMSVVQGYPMCQVRAIRHPGAVYDKLMALIVRLAQHGLIHGDFNEFNLLIDDEENVTMIDFPQMVSTSHLNAEYYFNRDVECIRVYFKRRYGYESERYPTLQDALGDQLQSLDVEVAASGFSKDDSKALDQALREQNGPGSDEEGDSDDEEDEESGDDAAEAEGEEAAKENIAKAEAEEEDESESEDETESESEGSVDEVDSMHGGLARRSAAQLVGLSSMGDDHVNHNRNFSAAFTSSKAIAEEEMRRQEREALSDQLAAADLLGPEEAVPTLVEGHEGDSDGEESEEEEEGGEEEDGDKGVRTGKKPKKAGPVPGTSRAGAKRRKMKAAAALDPEDRARIALRLKRQGAKKAASRAFKRNDAKNRERRRVLGQMRDEM